MADAINGKHFWCTACSRHWQSSDYCEPALLEGDYPDSGDDDPLNYYAKCTACGQWSRAVPHYYANLSKMRTTGPRTAAGKARSALNGFKHGAYAQPHHLLAPANRKYDICRDCEVKLECKEGRLRYCPFKQDLMVRFLAAYENGDMGMTKQFAGLAQGKLYIVLENMLSEVMNKGVLIRSAKINNGNVVTLKNKYGEETAVYEYRENPLIGSLPKVMDALGMTSDQQMLNPLKAGGDTEGMKGKLAEPADPINFLSQMKDLVSAIQRGAPEAAAAMRAEDEVSREGVDEDGEEAVPDLANPWGSGVNRERGKS